MAVLRFMNMYDEARPNEEGEWTGGQLKRAQLIAESFSMKVSVEGT